MVFIYDLQAMKIIDYNQTGWSGLQKALEKEIYPASALASTRRIIAAVRRDGDRALRRLTKEFDGVSVADFAVGGKERASARRLLTPKILRAFKRVAANIRRFNSANKAASWSADRGDGLIWGEKVSPLEAVGVYVPGGSAPLVSSVFMGVIPARLAGVKRIVVVSPPVSSGTVNPYILAAADFCGATEIYRLGGAQAIAALALGTETIPRVDKIVGPGNLYVTLAKKEVFGLVDIDLPAGPSEIAVLADASADPAVVAADILAQAEHGPGGRAFLISTSRRLVVSCREYLVDLGKRLSRSAFIAGNLRRGTYLVFVPSLKIGVELVNRIAPEHLEIMTRQPKAVLPGIKNAGAVFLGKISPVAAGDFAAGPSHVLPTGGGARFFSPLTVNDFLKKSSVIAYNSRALENDLAAIETMARLESLDAHLLSVRLRLNGKRGGGK